MKLKKKAKLKVETRSEGIEAKSMSSAGGGAIIPAT
jgi:hypothetical protein